MPHAIPWSPLAVYHDSVPPIIQDNTNAAGAAITHTHLGKPSNDLFSFVRISISSFIIVYFKMLLIQLKPCEPSRRAGLEKKKIHIISTKRTSTPGHRGRGRARTAVLAVCYGSPATLLLRHAPQQSAQISQLIYTTKFPAVLPLGLCYIIHRPPSATQGATTAMSAGVIVHYQFKFYVTITRNHSALIGSLHAPTQPYTTTYLLLRRLRLNRNKSPNS